MVFSWSVTAAFTFSVVSKWCPSRWVFNLGKRKKSQRLRSGKYRGKGFFSCQKLRNRKFTSLRKTFLSSPSPRIRLTWVPVTSFSSRDWKLTSKDIKSSSRKSLITLFTDHVFSLKYKHQYRRYLNQYNRSLYAARIIISHYLYHARQAESLL